MNQPKTAIDPWAVPTLIMWLLFFGIGLIPEATFWAARELGAVVTQNAIINSPSLVTIFLAMYLAFFAYHRCLDAGLSSENAMARAIQVGILGLIAFLPYPFYLLLFPGNLNLLGIGLHRLDELAAVFGLPVAKLLAWSYLLIVVVRSYLTSGTEAFVNMYPRFEQGDPEKDTDSTRE